ncbi:MAG: tetratricopeptide repeat protein [Planctomycetaceae bacterium]|jgi:tetratricopeptide (TPR) repeat protein
MKRSPRQVSTVRLLTIFVSITTASTFGADIVTRASDGANIRGKFESLSKTHVVIRQSNDRTEMISTDDIRDIRFDREPPPLQTARSNERSGSYTAAIQQLQEVRSDYQGSDSRIPVEIDFLIVRCQARLALADPVAAPTALQSLQGFLQENSDGYRTLESMLLQAELLAGTDAPAAVRLLEQLRGCGVDGFAMRAGVLLGHTLLDEGKLEQATQIFDKVVQESQDNPAALSTHYDSRLGRAECLWKVNEFQQSLAELKSLVAEVPDEQQQTLARAWNKIGDCYRDANQPRAALLAYLHVDILYAQSTAEHAEALHQLGPLWQAAGHPDRGRDAQSRLLTQYPNSKWAPEPGDQSAISE